LGKFAQPTNDRWVEHLAQPLAQLVKASFHGGQVAMGYAS
jgi:hypothetical protein